MMNYSIGEVARQLEICPQTLRNWEKKGFIPKPHRSPIDRRLYSSENIKQIQDYIQRR
jgi:DNA-binding transcriptional MerR regulator